MANKHESFNHEEIEQSPQTSDEVVENDQPLAEHDETAKIESDSTDHEEIEQSPQTSDEVVENDQPLAEHDETAKIESDSTDHEEIEQSPQTSDEVVENDQPLAEHDETAKIESDSTDHEEIEQSPQTSDEVVENDQPLAEHDETAKIESDSTNEAENSRLWEELHGLITADTGVQIAAAAESLFERVAQPSSEQRIISTKIEVDPYSLQFVDFIDSGENLEAMTIKVSKPVSKLAQDFRWEYAITYGMRNQFLSRHVLILNHEPKIVIKGPVKRFKHWLARVIQPKNKKDKQVAPKRTGEISYYYHNQTYLLSEGEAQAILEDLKMAGNPAEKDEATPADKQPAEVSA